MQAQIGLNQIHLEDLEEDGPYIDQFEFDPPSFENSIDSGQSDVE